MKKFLSTHLLLFKDYTLWTSYTLQKFFIYRPIDLISFYYYRPHPKDGEGNVFSLSTPGGGGTHIP